MLNLDMKDVLSVLQACKDYLIVAAIVIVLAIVGAIVCRRAKRPLRKLLRTQCWIAMLLAIVIIANLICTGPLSTVVSLATGGGKISDESIAEALALSEEIASEGITLLENDGMLPMKAGNLNVFGWASSNPCYGGTSSGSLSDTYDKVSLLQGLENSGFAVNHALTDFYTAYANERPVVGIYNQKWTLPEPPVASYDAKLLADAKEFSDTAMVVISRVGGEGADLPRDVSQVKYEDSTDQYRDFEPGEHYLKLSQTEENLINMVCENYANVILVYNGANAFEFGFIQEHPQIRCAIWCPGMGQSGFNALGRILTGEVNPSGKTVDIALRDLTHTPIVNNFGNFEYDNMSEFIMKNQRGNKVTPHFVNYVEGIYVGYRYYETAAAEGIIRYENEVLYPFGYGLSYTTFEQKMSDLTVKNGKITFDVTVTNTGAVAGKDVVQVYYNPPYTNGGIEKAAANLIAFEKTKLLKPGASQKISFSIDAEDMASYDYVNHGCYVLDTGNYGISIRANSHDIISEKIYTQGETIVYDQDHKRSSDVIPAMNHFDYADHGLVYLSRKDGFANREAATAAPASYSMDEENKSTFMLNNNYDPTALNNPADVMPVTGADNGVQLADLRGKSYDDPLWEKLLDELTVDEMNMMIGVAGYQTQGVDRIGKRSTIDCDGPASILNFFTRDGSIGFPSAIVVAMSWNRDLAHRFGESIGHMADEMDVSGWYAPAMNIHRSAFSGRNFEYYSEDPVLSGIMATEAMQGAWTYGVYSYLKHYALNDQETNRDTILCTWSNEQAIREIYLKPFEMAVKNGHATAVMSAYNFIGNRPAQADSVLLNTILRDEWGFRGIVLTDGFQGPPFQYPDRMIRNGNDAMLNSFENDRCFVKDTTSATSVLAMRQASKNIMYTVVNSRIYKDVSVARDLSRLQTILMTVDGAAGALLLLWEILAICKYKKRKNA